MLPDSLTAITDLLVMSRSEEHSDDTMTWDATRRVYLDDDGNEILPSQIREWVDGTIENAQGEINDKAGDLLLGVITVAAFFVFMGELLTSLHLAACVIAYGGEDGMNNARWGRVDDRISSELAYLTAFEEQVANAARDTEFIANSLAAIAGTNERKIAESIVTAIQAEGRADIVGTVATAVDLAGAEIDRGVIETTIDSFGDRIESLIWGEVDSRSRSYPNAAYGTYENSVRDRETGAGAIGVRRVSEDDDASCDVCPELATDEYVALNEIADIGDSPCASRCRCWFEFEYLNVDPLEIDREIYA